VIEENKRTDHPPPRVGQHPANLEAAQVAAALIDDELKHCLPAFEAARGRRIAAAFVAGQCWVLAQRSRQLPSSRVAIMSSGARPDSTQRSRAASESKPSVPGPPGNDTPPTAGITAGQEPKSDRLLPRVPAPSAGREYSVPPRYPGVALCALGTARRFRCAGSKSNMRPPATSPQNAPAIPPMLIPDAVVTKVVIAASR